jgi:hypothetical protein
MIAVPALAVIACATTANASTARDGEIRSGRTPFVRSASKAANVHPTHKEPL